MIYTKEIVKDKFWILENAGIKIGTIRFCSSDDFVVNVRNTDISNGIDNEHITRSELTQCFGEKILEAKESPVVVEENKVGPRGGWNTSMTEISKFRYVAGYYGVRFPSDWRWFYGGKLDTLNTCDFIGPYKTKSEMQSETLLANKRDGL